MDVEVSPATKEVWLITPDFKPDISDPVTGALVSENLKKGKKYVYFAPPGLGDLPNLISRLKSNLGVDAAKARLGARVATIQLGAKEFWTSLGAGNVIFFFKSDQRGCGSVAFREMVFTRVAERAYSGRNAPKGRLNSFITSCAAN